MIVWHDNVNQINRTVLVEISAVSRTNCILNSTPRQPLLLNRIGGSRGRARRTPLRVQILLFWQTKFWKCNCLRNPRPPTRSTLPYGKSWIRHWIVLSEVQLNTGNKSHSKSNSTYSFLSKYLPMHVADKWYKVQYAFHNQISGSKMVTSCFMIYCEILTVQRHQCNNGNQRKTYTIASIAVTFSILYCFLSTCLSESFLSEPCYSLVAGKNFRIFIEQNRSTIVCRYTKPHNTFCITFNCETQNQYRIIINHTQSAVS